MITHVDTRATKRRRHSSHENSGIEWIGEVPTGWEIAPIKAFCSLKSETGHSELPLLSLYRDFGVVPRYSREDNYNRPSLDLSNYQVVRPDDLVLNKMKTWQGSLAVSELHGVVSPAYIVCELSESVFPRYIHYLLRSPPYVSQYARHSYGVRVNQWDLHWEDFRQIRALIPPLPEQRAIATFLDRETDRIDTLIAKKERLIELLQEKRTALISRAVTKGLHPDVEMKDSGVEWLGEVPRHWGQVRLKRTITACQNGIWGDEPTGEDDLVCVRVADFDRVTRTISDDGLTMRWIPINKRDGRLLKVGDLLLEKSGGGDSQPVGTVVLFDLEELNGQAVCSNFIARMSVADGYSPRFLNYLHGVLYAGGVNTRSIKQNIGIQNLDSDQYLSELVAVPPLNEQRSIVSFLDIKTGRIDTLIEKVHQHNVLLHEYRIALISAAVTGKIDVRDAVPPGGS